MSLKWLNGDYQTDRDYQTDGDYQTDSSNSEWVSEFLDESVNTGFHQLSLNSIKQVRCYCLIMFRIILLR